VAAPQYMSVRVDDRGANRQQELCQNCVTYPSNPRSTRRLTRKCRRVSMLREIVDRECVGGIWCASARAEIRFPSVLPQPRVSALEQERDVAQRAPSARAGIPGYFHECAQMFSDAHAKSAMFSGDFETCDGSKNRRLRQCKMWIHQVLISVRLSVRGEVAERPNAAVC
jgi:hypothetical protein